MKKKNRQLLHDMLNATVENGVIFEPKPSAERFKHFFLFDPKTQSIKSFDHVEIGKGQKLMVVGFHRIQPTNKLAGLFDGEGLANVVLGALCPEDQHSIKKLLGDELKIESIFFNENTKNGHLCLVTEQKSIVWVSNLELFHLFRIVS